MSSSSLLDNSKRNLSLSVEICREKDRSDTTVQFFKDSERKLKDENEKERKSIEEQLEKAANLIEFLTNKVKSSEGNEKRYKNKINYLEKEMKKLREENEELKLKPPQEKFDTLDGNISILSKNSQKTNATFCFDNLATPKNVLKDFGFETFGKQPLYNEIRAKVISRMNSKKSPLRKNSVINTPMKSPKNSRPFVLKEKDENELLIKKIKLNSKLIDDEIKNNCYVNLNKDLKEIVNLVENFSEKIPNSLKESGKLIKETSLKDEKILIQEEIIKNFQDFIEKNWNFDEFKLKNLLQESEKEENWWRDTKENLLFFKECLREIQKYYIKDFQFLRNLSSSCISFFAVDGKTLLKNYDNSYLALDFSRLASYKENILIQFKKKEAAKICFLSLLKEIFDDCSKLFSPDDSKSENNLFYNVNQVDAKNLLKTLKKLIEDERKAEMDIILDHLKIKKKESIENLMTQFIMNDVGRMLNCYKILNKIPISLENIEMFGKFIEDINEFHSSSIHLLTSKLTKDQKLNIDLFDSFANSQMKFLMNFSTKMFLIILKIKWLAFKSFNNQ